MPNILFSPLSASASLLLGSSLTSRPSWSLRAVSAAGRLLLTPPHTPTPSLGWGGAGGPRVWLNLASPPPPHTWETLFCLTCWTRLGLLEGYLPFQGRSLTDFLAPSLNLTLASFFLPLPPLSPGLLTTPLIQKAPRRHPAPPHHATRMETLGWRKVLHANSTPVCARLSPLEALSWEGEAVAGVDTPKPRSSIFWHLPFH